MTIGVCKFRLNEIQKHFFGNNHGGMRKHCRLCLGAPSNHSLADSRQAFEQIFPLKNVVEELLRCLAEHDRRQLGTVHSLQY